LYQHLEGNCQGSTSQNISLMYENNFFFTINNQCQSTKLLKLDSLADELGDYLLFVNSLINYID